MNNNILKFITDKDHFTAGAILDLFDEIVEAEESKCVQLQNGKHHQQNTTGVLLPSILVPMKSSNFLTSSTPDTVTCPMVFLQSVQSNHRWKAGEKERLFRIEATSFEHFRK